MKKYVIGLVVCLLLSSCAMIPGNNTNSNTAIFTESEIRQEVQKFKIFYKKVNEFMHQTQKEKRIFTSNEWIKINNFNTFVDILILKFESLEGDFDPDDIEFMVSIAKIAYSESRQLILLKWSDFTISQQHELIELDSKMGLVDQHLAVLMKDPSQDNINSTLILISSALSVSIRMLSMLML